MFLETKQNPYYVFIDTKHSSQIDFERDGKKDLLIRLISFDDKKAIIEFKNLNVTEEENNFKSVFNFNFIYLGIGIIIFVVILALIHFKFRKTRIDKENAGAGI